jgi:hypothetical protein
VVVTALLDRLLHGFASITIRGDSYANVGEIRAYYSDARAVTARLANPDSHARILGVRAATPAQQEGPPSGSDPPYATSPRDGVVLGGSSNVRRTGQRTFELFNGFPE